MTNTHTHTEAVATPAVTYVRADTGDSHQHRFVFVPLVNGRPVVYLTEAEILAGVPEDPERGIFRGV